VDAAKHQAAEKWALAHLIESEQKRQSAMGLRMCALSSFV
jgi:hypothetical protein